MLRSIFFLSVPSSFTEIKFHFYFLGWRLLNWTEVSIMGLMPFWANAFQWINLILNIWFHQCTIESLQNSSWKFALYGWMNKNERVPFFLQFKPKFDCYSLLIYMFCTSCKRNIVLPVYKWKQTNNFMFVICKKKTIKDRLWLSWRKNLTLS